ncbi:MAG: cupin domain-containing protein, partial [Woeseiaceae bacterium]|nr:cupin domain-containing protein [Woeseiaceae bacterium]
MNHSRTETLDARDVEAQVGTTYPEAFRKEVASRSKRILGDLFGLKNYGVNLVDLEPGGWSSQRHWHTHEDEFVYVVSGELTLVTDDGEQVLTP